MAATILFNDLILFRQRSGIGHYAAELLEHFPAVAPDLHIVTLSSLPTVNTLARALSRGGAVAGHREVGGWKGRVLAAGKAGVQALLDKYLSLLVRHGEWDLVHEPDAIAFQTGAPTLISVHDLSVLLYPEFHPAHRVKRYEKYFMRSLASSSHFIAVSEATKQDMVQHLKVEAHRISAIPQAPRRGFRPEVDAAAAKATADRLRLPEQFFLSVGTLEPRKNTVGLLRAYSRLPGALRARFPLLIVGGWGWKSEATREMLGRSPWKDSVRHLGYLSEADLIAVTQAATALVYPSFYEGFGMPPLEAMACGTPVIASKTGGLAQAVGDAAYTIDPHDEVAIGTAMREVVESEVMRRDLSTRGLVQAAKFSWERTARETADVYRRLLARKI